MKINKILSYASITMAGLFITGCQEAKGPATTITMPKGDCKPCDVKKDCAKAKCDKMKKCCMKNCDKSKCDMKKCDKMKNCEDKWKGQCGSDCLSPNVKSKMEEAKNAMLDAEKKASSKKATKKTEGKKVAAKA